MYGGLSSHIIMSAELQMASEIMIIIEANDVSCEFQIRLSLEKELAKHSN
jgi:hypothetical protein